MTAETNLQSFALSDIAWSAATKQSILPFGGSMDCFASLAMTSYCGNASELEQCR
ncbi:MAG: hypothetical protein WCA28_23480 [Bradyrhizobium sp.]